MLLLFFSCRRPFVSDLLTVLRKEKFGNTDNEDFGGPNDPSDGSELVFTHGGKDFFFTPMITTDDHPATVSPHFVHVTHTLYNYAQHGP